MKHKTSAMLLANLVTGARSYADLMAMSGMSYPTVHGWVAALRAKRLIYIAEWGTDQRNYPTVIKWMWGPEVPDVYKPTRNV